jgi:energy-coupling factor transport system substrate-specific component
MKEKRYYLSTRDLLMMAALAALGGVTSTYVNAVGDFVQSIVGFAGTTQWAAGLHVLWLTLAVGLTGKLGAGTFTGLLKGAVELLSGNTHGLLVVLVDLVAGLLVDVGFFPFRDKDRLPAYALAGGLASASNVFVFQLFAALPQDILAVGAMTLVGVVAGLSGALFAGLLAYGLVRALRRAGVVKDQPEPKISRRSYLIALLIAAVLIAVFGVYLRGALKGPTTVEINGAVAEPYAFPTEADEMETITAEGTLRDVTRSYTGVPLAALIDRAQPANDAEMVLVKAADGYAFFITMEELRGTDALLLAPQGSGDERAYNVVGAENSKAWVRNVSEITVVGGATLEITGALEQPAPYDPETWQFEMDAVSLDLGDGPQKVQGAPLGKVLASLSPTADAATVVLHTPKGAETLALDDVLSSDKVRIFTVIREDGVDFAVARTSGDVIAQQVERIEVK